MVASKPGETAKAPQMQTKSFEKILIPLYLLVWLALTVSLGLSHEPFADEAQSFLIARDTGIAELLSTTARTEGTPVLWHLWLKLLLFVGLPYSLLFLASVLPEFAAVVLFVCKAPFSAAVRYLFPLTYYVFINIMLLPAVTACCFWGLSPRRWRGKSAVSSLAVPAGLNLSRFSVCSCVGFVLLSGSVVAVGGMCGTPCRIR